MYVCYVSINESVIQSVSQVGHSTDRVDSNTKENDAVHMADHVHTFIRKLYTASHEGHIISWIILRKKYNVA